MNEMELKYGCNPNQKPSRVYMEDGSDLPITVLNGKPGYINLLDALKGIKGSDRSSGSDFLQACLPGRCRSRSSDGRSFKKDLLGGRSR